MYEMGAVSRSEGFVWFSFYPLSVTDVEEQGTKKWPAVQYQCQQAWSKPMPSCNRLFFSVKILSQVPSGLPLYDNKNTNAVIWFSF